MKDSLRIKKLRNRIVVLGAVVVLLAAGYYFAYALISSMKSKTSVFESDSVVLQGQVDNAVSLQRQYDDQAAERSKIESFILPKDGEADFINVVESLAGEAGLDYQVQSVDLVPGSSSATNLQDLELKVSVSGSFQNVYQFLLLVENMPYSINIANVDMTANGQPLSDGSSTVAISPGQALWEGNFDVLVTSFK